MLALAITLTGSPGLAAAVLVINEIQSANSITVADEDGDHPDWIEIANVGDASIDLNGYGLSDDPDMPFKWTFPSKTLNKNQYLLVFASDKDRKIGPYFHTNYAIKSGGETITLTAPGGAIVSQVPAIYIPQEISYGCYPDGGSTYYFFAAPTPGAENTTTPYNGILSPPNFSRSRGFYSAAFNLTLSTSESGATIRYTTDGSDPTEASTEYTSPIPIQAGAAGARFKTTVVRARVFKAGYLTSPAATNSYFVGENSSTRYNLPIVSVSTDPKNLWDPEIGIYVYGNYGNYNQEGDEWERPMHVEFFEPGSSAGFSYDVGAKIHGSGGAALPQKSLRFYADHYGGPGKFNYQIFPESPLTDYTRIILRQMGGTDTPLTTFWSNRYTMIRDNMAQDLVRHLDVDTQLCRPCVVFLNGEFWGLQQLVERQDKYWLNQYHPEIDKDNLDLLQQEAAGIDVAEGDTVFYNSLINYLTNNDLLNPSAFEYAQTKMDVSSVILHYLIHVYGADVDWPRNNIRFWRERVDGPTGRLRWILVDCDTQWDDYFRWDHETMAYASTRGAGNWNQDYQRIPFANLLRVPSAREECITMMADMMNTCYKPSTVNAKIDELVAEISPYVQEHFTRWGAGTVTQWNSNLQEMKNYAAQRPAYIRNLFVKFFGLDGTANLTVNASGGGTVKVNSVRIPSGSYPWQGTYFQNVPTTLTAIPSTGYRFVRWEGGATGTANPVRLELQGNTTVTAVFEVGQ